MTKDVPEPSGDASRPTQERTGIMGRKNRHTMPKRSAELDKAFKCYIDLWDAHRKLKEDILFALSIKASKEEIAMIIQDSPYATLESNDE